jgi:hypothetical protein
MLNLATKTRTKEATIPLPKKAAVNLQVRGPDLIDLVISTKDGDFHYGTSSQINLREIINDATSIKVKSKKEFTLQYKIQERQQYEPIDDRPLPTPEDNTSPIMAMQRRIRQELGIIREEFTNDTDLPGYELDDEDEGLFEEETALLQEMQRKASEVKKETTHDTDAPLNEPAEPVQQTETSEA